jgi:hypothetical protein
MSESIGMKNDHLATYLNNHLAGSIGALEILDRVINEHEDQTIVSFFREMKEEIEADQRELREMMDAIDVSESSVRKAGAWVGEKLSRAKLTLGGKGVGLVQTLEGLVLGIKGKELLWRVLLPVQENWPELKRFDLNRLLERAIAQSAQMDEKRIQVAGSVFRE